MNVFFLLFGVKKTQKKIKKKTQKNTKGLYERVFFFLSNQKQNLQKKLIRKIRFLKKYFTFGQIGWILRWVLIKYFASLTKKKNKFSS